MTKQWYGLLGFSLLVLSKFLHTYDVIVLTYLHPFWTWSFGSWIYNYLCYQRKSPLMLWVRISNQYDVYTIMWYSLSVTCDRSVVFRGPLLSSTNKTDRYDITEILHIIVYTSYWLEIRTHNINGDLRW
jgi:hypothetical protein